MTKTLGMKYDQEKPRMGLLPPHALLEVSKVLTFGAQKYAPDNWKFVENGPERYRDAALRHITATMQGEVYDPESGLHHLAHAICCLMFIIDVEKINLEKQEQEESDLDWALSHVKELDSRFLEDLDDPRPVWPFPAEFDAADWTPSPVKRLTEWTFKKAPL